MTTTIINGITVLAPAEGKYLTNGETYSTKVYLGKHASAADWQEVDAISGADELSAEEALKIIMGGDIA